jgi:hypothetical protein
LGKTAANAAKMAYVMQQTRLGWLQIEKRARYLPQNLGLKPFGRVTALMAAKNPAIRAILVKAGAKS